MTTFTLIAEETIVTRKSFTVTAETLAEAKAKLESDLESSLESENVMLSPDTDFEDISLEIYTPAEYEAFAALSDESPWDDDDYEPDDEDLDADDDDDYEPDDDDFMFNPDNDHENKWDFDYEETYCRNNDIPDTMFSGWLRVEKALDRKIPYADYEALVASLYDPLETLTDEEIAELYEEMLA